LLIVEKILLLAKQTRVRAKKTRGTGIKVTRKKRNAASNLSWQSVGLQDPCRIVFENFRCAWNRSSWHSDLKICLFSKNFPSLLHIAIVHPKWSNFITKYPPISGKLSITNYLKQNAVIKAI